jgi:hypothetical protein
MKTRLRRNSPLTPLDLREHLGKLRLNDLMSRVVGTTVEPDKRGLGFFLPTLLGEPPGRVGQDEHPSEHGVSRCPPCNAGYANDMPWRDLQ